MSIIRIIIGNRLSAWPQTVSLVSSGGADTATQVNSLFWGVAGYFGSLSLGY